MKWIPVRTKLMFLKFKYESQKKHNWIIFGTKIVYKLALKVPDLKKKLYLTGIYVNFLSSVKHIWKQIIHSQYQFKNFKCVLICP